MQDLKKVIFKRADSLRAALGQMLLKVPLFVLLIYYFLFQAVISGDLDILKDWCYEAVSININNVSYKAGTFLWSLFGVNYRPEMSQA